MSKLIIYKKKVIVLTFIMFVLPHFAYSQKKKSKTQSCYTSIEFDFIRTTQYFNSYAFYKLSAGYYSKKNWINEIQMELNKGILHDIGFGIGISKYIHSDISIFSSVNYITNGQFYYDDIPDYLFTGGISNFYKKRGFFDESRYFF